MTRILVLLSFAMHLFNPADAHAATGGRIGLYSDVGLSACQLTDTNPRIADVYVVHRVQGSQAALGVVGVMLALAPSAGFNGSWLEDIVPFGLGANGTSPSGIAVGSLTCWSNDKLLLHVRYQMLGGSSSCSFVEAVSYPSFAFIVTTTCGVGLEMPVDGGRIYVNPDSSCPCEVPVATEPTTWGRIKAMYRE